MCLRHLREKHLVALKETNEKEQADAFVAYLKKENIVTNEEAIVKRDPHHTGPDLAGWRGPSTRIISQVLTSMWH